MQSAATTPDEYLASLDDDWRRVSLLALRDLVIAEAPELQESIEYKMLAFGTDDGALFHLNAQKNYVSLYVGDAEAIDPGSKWISDLDVGKGCLRFKKSRPVEETQIGAFIAEAVRLWRSGDGVRG